MLFQSPELQPIDVAVLKLIAGQRERLRVYTQTAPKRWSGSLRRSTLARAIRGSNSIEGIHASLETIMAAVENEDLNDSDVSRDTLLSIRGYRNAMTYIMQAAQDPHFEFSKQFLKSLQFMIVGHDMAKNPGQWRPGPVYIVNQATKETVYVGPPVELVDQLVQELVLYLKTDRSENAIVRAAMAHLNCTMIHPFSDGNGRISRALQTLVLAQEGLLHPAFCSIEEWLGRVTPEYYAVLAEVGQGKWQPKRSALPWVRFCLTAHYHQAATLLRRNSEYERLFAGIVAIIERENLPERSTLPLFDAALGWSITNSWYRRDAEVSELVASRDLKRLSDLELLEPKGEKRGRSYDAGKELQDLRKLTREDAPFANPYDILKDTPAVENTLNEEDPLLPGLGLQPKA